MEKMSYYDQICERDIITKCKRMLQNGGYFLRDIDGKIDAERRVGWDTPWHHVRHHPRLDCMMWHKIMFDVIFKALGKKWVPIKCQDCYKVVVRPRNLKELFALLELQKRLGKPAKCGIETRETVHGLYGGYFYNVGLNRGLDCWSTVRQSVNDDPLLGKGVNVILKRACTEYEMDVGDSDKWEISDEQRQVEELVETYVVADNVTRDQSEQNIMYIHRKWIEWAYSMGDPTYQEFTGGQPLYKPYVTYENIIQEGARENAEI